MGALDCNPIPKCLFAIFGFPVEGNEFFLSSPVFQTECNVMQMRVNSSDARYFYYRLPIQTL